MGKTRLSVALAEVAIQVGFGAYFITVHDLVADLSRAMQDSRPVAACRSTWPRSFCMIDEMGCLPLDEIGATIFLKIGKCTHERGSIFGDLIFATAILDWLPHRLQSSTSAEKAT